MDVRIRHELDVTSRRHSIGDVPIEQLDTLIPALLRWGISYEGDDAEELIGQVAIVDGVPFFDLFIPDDHQ